MTGHKRILALMASVLVIVAGACGGEDLEEARPRARILQSELDFGPVRVGASAELTLEIRNEGASPLVVEDPEIAGEAHEEWFRVSPASLLISPGSAAGLTVSFTPLDETAALASLQVPSNDAEAGTLEVALRGSGFIPAVEAGPASLDFGTLVVDTDLTREITLSNLGEQTALAHVQRPAGSGAAQFHVAEAEGPGLTLIPGETSLVEVTYAPTSSGTHFSSFVIEPCEGCSAVSISLTGEAIESGLHVSPSSFDFGMARPGAPLTAKVTFQNVGNVDLEVTGLDLVDPEDEDGPVPAFGLVHPPLPLALAAESGAVVDVVFTPPDLGVHEARLDWTATDRRNDRGYLPLRGRGGAPWIELVPDELTFGLTAVGIPIDGTLVIANRGEEDLVVDAVTIPEGAPFRLIEPIPSLVPQGEARPVRVVFEPVAEGMATAVLTVESNDPHDPEVHAALEGEALDLDPCNLSVDPEEVAFGIIERGLTQTRQVRLRNDGTEGESCLLVSVDLSDDDGGAFRLVGGPIEGALLEGGEGRALQIAFRPDEHGSFAGTLEIHVSDPAAPLRTVALGGASVETHVLIAPDRLDFGPLPVGCGSGEREICVYNTRPAPVTLRDVAFSPGTPGVFTTHGLPAGLGEPGVSLGSGGSVCFGVRFEAEAIVDYLGQIAITLDEIGHPFMAALSGSGDPDSVQTEHFEQPGQAVADVLFVIHAGGYPGLLQLGDHIGAFFDVADQLGVDYHVGIIYADGRDAHGGGVLRPLDRSTPHILTPSTPDAAFTFRENVGLHYSGAPLWHYLWSTEKALHPSYQADPQLNEGFLRPEAHLSLVYMIVEPDWSHDVCGFLDDAPGCGTTDYYLSAFMRAKGFRPGRLSIHAVLGDPSETRIDELIERTGGIYGPMGLYEWEWPDHLAELAPHAFGYRTRFFLENQPDPETLDVHIITATGQRLPADDWSYDPNANAIVFEPPGVPGPGQTVEVTYQAVCAL